MCLRVVPPTDQAVGRGYCLKCRENNPLIKEKWDGESQRSPEYLERLKVSEEEDLEIMRAHYSTVAREHGHPEDVWRFIFSGRIPVNRSIIKGEYWFDDFLEQYPDFLEWPVHNQRQWSTGFQSQRTRRGACVDALLGNWKPLGEVLESDVMFFAMTPIWEFKKLSEFERGYWSTKRITVKWQFKDVELIEYALFRVK